MLRLLTLVLLALASYVTSAVLAPVPESAAQQKPVRWAYYVPDDPTSLASLREHAAALDYVGLHWTTLKEDATLEIKSSADVISLVRNSGARPVLSVCGSSPEAVSAVLSSPSLRATAIDNLVRATSSYDGISIDFEGIDPADRNLLTSFMADLYGRLHPAGKVVTMALSAKSVDLASGWAGAHDYAALAPHSDLFIVMAYGFRTARSTVPGSSAPRSWAESCIAYAASQIPPRKLLLGVPFYGYDWDTTAGPPAKVVRYQDASSLASQHRASIQYDPVQGSAHFIYSSSDAHDHDVWFEDRSTIQARMSLIDRYGLAGVAGWRLGHEDPAVWQLFSPPPTPTPAPAVTATPVPTTAIPSGTTWFFAEGSTAKPFDTWLLLQNPGTSPATVRLTFMLEGGGIVTSNVLVEATSRKSIYVNQIVASASFSTRIDSDRPILAERAMYTGFEGHDVTAVAAPSTTWYLAEGSTASPFHTWILLQNPNGSPTTAHLTFQAEDGATTRQDIWIAANARSSLFVNQVLPNAAFSTRVDSDLPIIAERAMYRFPGNAATGVTAVPAPAKNWYFAAGMPAFLSVPADAWLLLQNPNNFPVTASVTFLGTDGQTSSVQKWLPPASRQSIFASQAFRSPSFGIKVEADGDVIAERSVFIGPSQPGGEAQGAYATQGSSQLSTVWALPEGSTAPPFTERISVLNPNQEPMDARFEFMLEGGQMVLENVTIQPFRAFDLAVESAVRSAPASAKVTTSLPSAVERTMYWVKDGKTGAHDTIGIPMK